jgi:beta-lactamase superfamily II metal-dependent hydrolase
MRIVFLYVGQGEATLVLMPDGMGHHLSMLIDCNRAEPLGGVNLPKLLMDVLPKDAENWPALDVFLNTHPHSDHLGGLDEIRKVVRVREVWHSGHTPSSKHKGPFAELAELIKEVRKRGGKEIRLEGSRTPYDWGAGAVHVLSPAEYIVDEIENETPDQRDARIHDQCAVVRIAYGSESSKTRVMITGDSDKQAWIRITGYHGEPEANRLSSHILSASHHGSYTFFKDRPDDPEPYDEHVEAIAPDRVVISAPDQKDSQHDHPDDDAVKRYTKAVGKDFVHHMGSRGWSFFIDAFSDGTYSFNDDRGELARKFAFGDDNDDGNGGGGSGAKRAAPAVISFVERSRPMGFE